VRGLKRKPALVVGLALILWKAELCMMSVLNANTQG
jgi:hypothetical protein